MPAEPSERSESRTSATAPRDPSAEALFSVLDTEGLMEIDPAIVWSCVAVGAVGVAEKVLALDGRTDREGRHEVARWVAVLVGVGVADRLIGSLPTTVAARAGLRTIVGSAAAAWWGHAGPSSIISDRLVTIATAAPSVSVWAAGIPDAGIDLTRAQRATIAASASLPATLAGVLRHRRGEDPRWGQVAWGPLIAVVASTALQARHAMRRRVAERWWIQTRPEIESYRLAARLSAATRRTPGHDFKKVLAALGYFGSEPARRAAAEQMSWPASQTPDAGMTLAEVAIGRPIRPVVAGGVWLLPGQVVRVAEFLARCDAASGEGTRPLPVLVERDVTVLRLSVGSATLQLEPDSWTVRFLLDTFAVGVATFSAFRLAMLAVYPAAPMATIATRLVDAAALRLRSRSVLGQRTDEVLLTVMMVGAAVEAQFVAADQARWLAEGREVRGQPFFTFVPVAFALMTRWPFLGRYRFVLGGGLGASMAVTLRRARLPWFMLARAVASMLPTIGPAYAIRSVVEDDAVALDLQLADELNRQLDAAHRRAAEDELARFRDQLDLAVTEMARLGDRVPAAVAAELASEIDTMRAWLDDPSAIDALFIFDADEDADSDEDAHLVASIGEHEPQRRRDLAAVLRRPVFRRRRS